MPIEYNSQTSEPFIRLPPPHQNIILTPPRPGLADEDALVAALNDPQVYVKFLSTPPLPFLREHATEYIARSVEDCDRLLREWDAGSGFVDGCPFRCIREESTEADDDDDDDDVLIGDITFFRYEFPPGSEGEDQEKAQERNKNLAAGNTDLLWGVGFGLSPPHHRRGIMTAALRTVIEEWALPCMNARVIKASALAENEGSLKVLKKNGFHLETTVDWQMPLASKSGGKKSVNVLRWVAPDSDSLGQEEEEQEEP